MIAQLYKPVEPLLRQLNVIAAWLYRFFPRPQFATFGPRLFERILFDCRRFLGPPLIKKVHGDNVVAVLAATFLKWPCWFELISTRFVLADRH